MKKLFLCIATLFLLNANSQTWNITNTGSKTTQSKFLGVLSSDSGNIIGSVNSLTNCHLKTTLGSLVVYQDSLYYRGLSNWINITRGGGGVGGNTIYTGDGTLSGNRHINANSNGLYVDSLWYAEFDLIHPSAFKIKDHDLGVIFSAAGGSSFSQVRFDNVYSTNGYARFLMDATDNIFEITDKDENGIVSYPASLSTGYTDTFATQRYARSVAGGGSGFWTDNGNDIYNNNTGNVGIGITTPQGILDVVSGSSRLLLDQTNKITNISHNGGDDQIYLDGTNHTIRMYANDQSSYYQDANSFRLSNGGLYVNSLTNAISDKQLMFNSSTGEFTYSDTIAKLNISDTASMLAAYLRSSVASGTYATIAIAALKVAIADTANMLTKYLRKSDTTPMLLPYLNSITSNSDALYNTATFSSSNHVGTITQNLATQSTYKLFGTGSSSATPTFRNIDSNYWNNTFATQVRAAQTSGVTSIATTAPLLGGTVTTTGTLSIDTGRYITQVSTGGGLKKVTDSLGSLISAKQSTLTATQPITITSNVIAIRAAALNDSGYITAGTQTFGGSKTFNNALTASSSLGVTGAITATGNTHRLGNLQFLTSGTPSTTGQGITCTGADREVFMYGTSAMTSANNTFSFNVYSGTGISMVASAIRNFLSINGGVTNALTNGSTGNILNITPTYNNTGGISTNTIRGIYYNPTLTSLTGTTHIGLELVSGSNYLNSTSGNTGIGLASGATITDKLTVAGNLNLNTAGNKINIATGSNASVGSSGTVTVSTTAVTASSIILLTLQNCSTCGTPYISAKTASTSFVITSTNVLDGSIVAYQIIN
jgi:hypothetical protein